jgi:hypothetical protein
MTLTKPNQPRTICTQQDSLTTCIQVAQHTKVDIQLTVADKQIGQSGNKIRDTLQGHISAMKEAAAIQADQDARANNNLHAEQNRQAPAEKDDDAPVETSKGTNEVPDEVQDKADNGQEDDTQAINSDDAQPDTSAREGDTQDGDAQTDQDGIRQLTPCVPSDKDVDIVAMAPKPAESVGPTVSLLNPFRNFDHLTCLVYSSDQ